MEKIVVAEGKTIEEAVQKALDELGTTYDKVKIKVLEVGGGGFMGIGNKNAKVEVKLIYDFKEIATNFLTDVFKALNITGDVKINSFEENRMNVEVSTKDRAVLIGRHGQTLDSLQYLLSLAVNKTSDEYIKVVLDVQGYREKRKHTLEELASRLAKKVSRSKSKFELEPMNPYERRIIHSYLQEFKNITTYSVGEDNDRHIVIQYKREA